MNAHTKFPVRFALALAVVAPLSFGCDNADEKVFKSPGNVESKPAATLLSELKGGSQLGGDAAAPTVSASVTYTILIDNLNTMKPKAGVSVIKSAADGDPTGGVCSGEFSADIMTNFTFQFPTAEIQCIGLVIDVAKMLNGGLGGLSGGAGAGSGGASDVLNALQHDGKVLSTTNLMGATFTPARPLLLGPIVQDATKYQGFKQTYATTVSGAGPDGKQYNAGGSFNVEVLDAQTKYTNKDIGALPALDKILHWKMTTTGFEGVPVVVGGLIPSIELFWNVRPLMIPKIVVEADGGQLLNGFIKDSGGLGVGKLAGHVVVTVRVKDFKLK